MKSLLQKLRTLLAPAGQVPSWITPRWLRIALRVGGIAAAVVMPLFCFAQAELINFGSRAHFRYMWESRGPVVAFDLLVLVLLYVLFALLFRRMWAAGLALWLISTALPVASYLKFQTTGDYLYPWDFQQAAHLDILTDYIVTPLPPIYFAAIIGVFSLCVLMFFGGIALPLRWPVRIPAALLLALACVLSLNTEAKIQKTLNRFTLYIEDTALQSSNYEANGFIGAFVLNFLSSFSDTPADYTQANVAGILENCTSAPAGESFTAPDVILILSESFWDITQLPAAGFSRDPLANYRAIAARENAYSGKFYTTAFGGGTIRPEFEVLTGLTSDYLPGGCVPYQYIMEETDSYASLFAGLGYRTAAIHPYLSSFYMRQSKYPLLGFDETHFVDELEALPGIEETYRGKQVSDDTFVDYLIHYLESADAPMFLFCISMEAHQPYAGKFAPEEMDITVSCPDMDAETLDLVNQYTQCLADADAALARLTDYIDSRDRDTILVYFGDHAPTLGANYAAYAQSGLLADPGHHTHQDRMIMQSTPFLIYANFPLQTDNAMLTPGPDNHLASYQLMNAACALMDAPVTPLMAFLRQYYALLPNYNVRLAMPVDDRQQQAIDAHRLLTYDVIYGRRWLYRIP